MLDGGACGRGIESTVVSLCEGVASVLRLGATPVEAIESVVGDAVEVKKPSSRPGLRGDGDDAAKALPAPGMTDRHYAPGTPMTLVTSLEELAGLASQGKRLGLIGMGELPAEGFDRIQNLSLKGDPNQAAANLFAALRSLDDAGLEGIVALALPERGLGRAINDRLRRGSTA